MRLLIFLTLFSCSVLDEPHFEIANDIKPSINKFYAQALHQGIYPQRDRLIVQWGNTIEKFGVIGITIHDDIPIIYLDYSLQDRIKSDPLFFETVLYHELGHALFLRPHCNSYSLMNPNKYIQDYRQDSIKRERLFTELITGF